MIEISLNKVNKNYGENEILKDISFDIKTKDKVAIVGENGSGKSTLLKLITKIEQPTKGMISIRKNIKIGYLTQDIKEEKGSVKKVLYNGLLNIKKTEEKLKKLEEKMLKAQDEKLNKIINEYTTVQDEYIRLGGYEVDEKIGKLIKKFKIDDLLDLDYSVLSGGQKRIISFIKVLLTSPDVLVLDEVTNHIDIKTLEILENYIKEYNGTVIIVSHDRYFLDQTSTKTILIENKKAYIYNGNYSYYLIEDKKRKEKQQEKYITEQKQIEKTKQSIKRLREFGRIGDNERFFKRAKSMEKRLEKMNKTEKVELKKEIPLKLDMNKRSGRDVLTIENLSFSYPNKELFNKVSLHIKYQDHVCIMGENGSGKSTLINIILNDNDKVKLGSNIKLSYIPQDIKFKDKATIYEIARASSVLDEVNLRSALAKFYFTSSRLKDKIESLSGGEKVRLKLFCIMQEEPNFLILDEVTNHIDITTRCILEDVLTSFKGTILFISHDRYFINKIATKTICISNKKLIEYNGNYDYVKEKRDINA